MTAEMSAKSGYKADNTGYIQAVMEMSGSMADDSIRMVTTIIFDNTI